MDPSADLLLEIPRGLEQSILLAVLIGFVVTLLLVESFGWVFVGVVVPGYLASVLVIQPQAGLAVLLDASLTYIVAKGLEMVLRRGGASSEFFGRERFFLLVLVSVFVRQHTQTWIWPLALESIEPLAQLPEGFQRSFSSIGIVLVPLMANIMWKLDMRRGVWQLTITTLVTYVLLALWLLPETTLSYSAMELSYEDTAVDFLGNAKAYIIFLCTAYVAAQLNLYYGWDFNGILVPALLGLLWFHPAKLAATFAEAVVVYIVTVRMPRAPGLRALTLEGPRRLALVFITSVVLKWIAGWALGDDLPTLKITDAYGFGYLLPSLLVIKMMQRKSIRAVMLPTLVASLLGFVIGNIVGFALSFVDPPFRPTSSHRLPIQSQGSTRLLSNAAGVGALGHLHALEPAAASPSYASSVAYRRVWTATARWLDEPTPETEASVLGAVATTDLVLVPVGDHEGRAAYALVERSEGTRHGWDTALLIPGAPGPVLAVPRPVAEAPLAEAAMVLCRRVECRALLVSGLDVERDPLTRLDTKPFDLARDALRDTPMLVLRSDPNTSRKPILHVGDELPSIDLTKIWPDEIGLDWTDPPVVSAGPLPTSGGILRFSPHDVDALLLSSSPPIRDARTPPSWVTQRKRAPTVRTLPATPPPSAREARYLELELIAPLVAVASGQRPTSELERLAWRAHRLQLELWRIDDCGDARPCLGLLDPLGEEGVGWGSLLIRWGKARAIGVEVPRPGRAFGTHQLGLELWHQSDARAIYIGPSYTSDRLDPLALGNIQAPLMPYHQALDRSLGDGTTRPLLLQILGFGVERTLDTDVVVALGRPMLEERQQPLKLRWMFEQGPLHWFERVFSDGSPQLHPLSGLGTPAVEYSLELGDADVALLWFSPEVRQRYVWRSHGPEERRARALGLDYIILPEIQALAPVGVNKAPAAVPPPRQVEFDELVELALSYRSSHNIHALRQLLLRAKTLTNEDVSAQVVIGKGAVTKLPLVHIQLYGPDWSLRGLVLLDTAVEHQGTHAESDPELRRELGQALLRRDATIVVHSGPARGARDAP